MKIIFLGTPEFAIPTLESLFKSNHQLVGIISQPDRIQDRGRKIVFSPVKKFALEHNIPIMQFEKLSRDGVESIRSLAPDIMVSASYGQILSQEIIDIPKYGIINVHPSLLPEFRGASPIQTAIIKGCTQTGVTVMRTEAGLDTGDIIISEKVSIGEEETYGELADRLAVLGAKLAIETLDMIENGTVEYTKQSHVDATVTKRISKEEGRIVWEKPATQLKCQILGQNPAPIAFSYVNNICCKIYRARVAKDIVDTSEPVGTIIEPTSVKNGIYVQCGKGVLEILELQFPGGKVLKSTEALNGRKLKLGDRFLYSADIKTYEPVVLNNAGKLKSE